MGNYTFVNNHNYNYKMTNSLNQMGRILTQNTNLMKTAIEANVSTLSLVTGVPKRTLQRIEAARKARRTYRPMLKTVVKLAQACGVTVDEYIQTRLEFQ